MYQVHKRRIVYFPFSKRFGPFKNRLCEQLISNVIPIFYNQRLALQGIYHRKLKRLVAIELKIGKFKAAYKGQMELYLRWLEKYEMEPGENLPIGLILCAEGNKEQIELLQLDKANIKVAEYISKQLPRELLENKLHQFAEKARKIIDNRNNG